MATSLERSVFLNVISPQMKDKLSTNKDDINKLIKNYLNVPLSFIQKCKVSKVLNSKNEQLRKSIKYLMGSSTYSNNPSWCEILGEFYSLTGLIENEPDYYDLDGNECTWFKYSMDSQFDNIVSQMIYKLNEYCRMLNEQVFDENRRNAWVTQTVVDSFITYFAQRIMLVCNEELISQNDFDKKYDDKRCMYPQLTLDDTIKEIFNNLFYTLYYKYHTPTNDYLDESDREWLHVLIKPMMMVLCKCNEFYEVKTKQNGKEVTKRRYICKWAHENKDKIFIDSDKNKNPNDQIKSINRRAKKAGITKDKLIQGVKDQFNLMYPVPKPTNITTTNTNNTNTNNTTIDK